MFLLKMKIFVVLLYLISFEYSTIDDGVFYKTNGLAAAKLLQETGLDVLVLEASDRVGGRTLTEHNSNVGYVDFGGAYVGPTQNRVLRLADEFGIKTHLTNEDQDMVYYTQGKSERYPSDSFPACGFLELLDMNNFLRLIDKMGEEIPHEAPWKAPHAKEWDQMTMQQFLDKHVWTKLVRGFAKEFVNVNATSEPYEASERKFLGGSQQISQRIAEKLDKDRVLLGDPVCHISQTVEGVTVSDTGGQQFRAKRVIISTPLPLQNKITYDPPLPSLRNQLIQRIPMGSVIKTFCYYKTPFWKEKGYCGITSIDDDAAMAEFTMDDTNPDGKHPVLLGFVLADKAKRFVAMRGRRVHVVCTQRSSNQTRRYIELRRPVGNLYFAGTETATQWSGYMDGAVQAGERAAREILFAMEKISKDEIWQEEKENPVVKAYPFESTFLERNLPSVGGFLKCVSITTALAVGLAGLFLL